MVDRSVARELARQSIKRGDPTGWFEELYLMAEYHPEIVPWADRRPNPHLVAWAENNKLAGTGRSALVVGCGYGDDAEWLAGRGFDVVAFDVSRTAIQAAHHRFPNSEVNYLVADALNLPEEWRGAFDFVFESYTLQVLHGESRATAARMIASTVKETLLIVARGRTPDEDPGKMPWPLTLQDFVSFEQSEDGLIRVSFEDFMDDEDPPVRRFRAVYRRK
ncbi:MAG: class I SAM-dependent methyltransferase [Nitrososphaerota archaeon]|nr:class I SAM-dependent methyltransferase [Nitrososphaerota archaeon]